MKFKKTKDGWISKHFEITVSKTYLEFMLPDGRYCYYEFEPNHKIGFAITWHLGKLQHTKMP